MNLIKNREKLYGYVALAFYIGAWLWDDQHLFFALFSLIISGILALQTIPSDADNKKYKRKELLFVLAAFMQPALIIFWNRYQENAQQKQFKNYVSEHRCKYAGDKITGVSKGGCDRFGNCEDPQEIEEQEFFCRATGNHLTYSEFKAGHYGR
jgi:hypothetical protein